MKEESPKKLKKQDIKQEDGSFQIEKRHSENNIDTVVQKSKNSKALVQDSSEIQGVHKWWEQEVNSDDDETKWEYLEHHGVLFPPFYQKHNVRPLYKNEPIELTKQQEEMATYWSQSIGSIWEESTIYKQNFQKMFMDTFNKNSDVKSFDNFNFTPIVNHLQEIKEKRKNMTLDDKKIQLDTLTHVLHYPQKPIVNSPQYKPKPKIIFRQNKVKLDKEQKDRYYGNAVVDQVLEKIGGYLIEAPTLFKGRGAHPKAGFMKGRILPEEITLNIAQNAPVPKCEVPGRCWKDIQHNNKVTWLAYYKDDTINVAYKYIFLSAASKFKGLNDRKKYEKARKLKDCINRIRDDYTQKMKSKDFTQKQLGTATYLIDQLALRVGNEKSEDEADTVGTCSLRIEHIKLIDDFQIEFDFLGKDSMRYFNTVKLDEIVYKNIQEFIKGKSPTDDLFDKINASSLNDYLRQLMDGLSAKVFRTYNASITLQKELSKKDLSKMDLEQKVNYYDEANKQVAILCNHQKSVPKNFDLQKEKLEEKVNLMSDYVNQLESHMKKQTKSKLEGYEKKVKYQKIDEKAIKDPNDSKLYFIMKFPADQAKTLSLLEQTKKKYQSLQQQLKSKEDNKTIALGTSKINYNDPRISVVWCKNNEVPIEKVFAKALRLKFPWAMPIDPSWVF